MRFLVRADIAADVGSIIEFDPADLTPEGHLTYQAMLGPHGSEIGEFSTREEALACLRAWEAESPRL